MTSSFKSKRIYFPFLVIGLIIVIALFFFNPYFVNGQSYKLEKEWNQLLQQGDTSICILSSIHSVSGPKFKLKDLKTPIPTVKQEKNKQNNDNNLEIIKEQEPQQEGNNQTDEPLDPITKIYWNEDDFYIWIGKDLLTATIDLEKETIAQIRIKSFSRVYVPNSSEAEITIVNDYETNQILKYYSTDNNVSPEPILGKRYIYTSCPTCKDVNGNAADKQSCFAFAQKLNTIIYNLIRKYKKCESPAFVFSINKDTLSEKINSRIKNLIKERSDDKNCSRLIECFKNKKMKIVCTKEVSRNADGFYSKAKVPWISPIEETILETLVTDEVRHYAKSNVAYKYGMPAYLTKTILITIDNGIVSSINY